MTTQLAFKMIHKPQEKDNADCEYRSWGKDTQDFKKARNERLTRLCK